MSRNVQQVELEVKHQALQYMDGLYGYALVLTRNPTDAEDLTQETYLRALRAFGTLRPDSNLKSWLFTILRNVWRNQIRRAQSDPIIADVDEDSAESWHLANESGNDPSRLYFAKVTEGEVKAAIENLADSLREVIVLRVFEELSYGEIAIILDCPIGTVMSRLARARDALRLSLKYSSAVARQDVAATKSRIT